MKLDPRVLLAIVTERMFQLFSQLRRLRSRRVGSAPPGPTLPLRLKITSDPANLARVRRAVEDLALAGGFQGCACGEIALCVNEALANVMRHAYAGATDRPIEFDAEMAGDELRIRIRDWGSGVNPDQLPPRPRDPLTPGGLGLICLRRLMDHVRFIPQDQGMLLEMSRTIRR